MFESSDVVVVKMFTELNTEHFDSAYVLILSGVISSLGCYCFCPSFPSCCFFLPGDPGQR